MFIFQVDCSISIVFVLERRDCSGEKKHAFYLSVSFFNERLLNENEVVYGKKYFVQFRVYSRLFYIHRQE